MKKWMVRIAVVVGLVAIGVVLRETLLAPEPVAVKIVPASMGRVESTITNSQAGTVKARTRAGLSTGTSGIVKSLDVDRGDRVEQGQVLLRLDDSQERSELEYAQRQLDVAHAQNARTCVSADRALREWERNNQLDGSSSVSEDRLDALRTAYDLALADCGVASANVQLATAAVEVAQVGYDKTALRAPFDAVIADVSIEVGEWVTPSVPLLAAPDLIDAIDTSSLYISAPMDEVDALLLRLGQRVRVTIDSHPDQFFWARLVRRAPYVLDIEQQNRTLEIEVELDDAEFSAKLLPGTSADVEVILEVRENVLRVPTYAIMEGGRVLVLEDGRLDGRRVETGIRNWDWTEVTAGLEAGVGVVSSLDRPGVTAGAEAVEEQDEDEQ